MNTFRLLAGTILLVSWATQQPERVEAMILVAATSYFPESAREVMRSVRERFAEVALEFLGET